MSFGMVLIFYVAFVALVVLLTRRRGTKLFYLLAFAVNTAAICWLLFLFGFLTSDEHVARGLGAPSDSWLPRGCVFLAVLLIPFTIVGLARGERSGHTK
jgi:hypothetical protein